MHTKQEIKTRVNIQSFTLANWVKEKSKEIKLLRLYIKNKDIKILNFLKEKGALVAVSEEHNLITTRGFETLTRFLSGDTTYTGGINYGALGTAVSPSPALASTQLGTESYRKLYSSRTFDNNIAYIDFFYAATDCNGTYTEFGNFVAGSGTANSGRLFSYLSTGGWVKSNVQSLFVSCKYTLT
jgi:hypothetical protein